MLGDLGEVHRREEQDAGPIVAGVADAVRAALAADDRARLQRAHPVRRAQPRRARRHERQLIVAVVFGSLMQAAF